MSNHSEQSHAVIARLEPKLGQHTVQVLEEAGFKEEEIEKLLRDKVVHLSDLRPSL